MNERFASTTLRRSLGVLGLAGLATAACWSGAALAAAQPAPAIHAVAEEGTPHRVQFARGTDHATVHGAIGDGVSDTYVLRAGAGQQMTISGLGVLHVSVTAPGGAVLPGGPGDTITFALPTTGDYVVQIMPGMGEQTAYDVTFTIPAANNSGAIRVQFAPGTDHATVHGAINDNVSDTYVLRLGRGQQLTISGLGVLRVSVTAPGGAMLPGGPGDTITFALPTTGDYVVQIMPGMGEQTVYDVTFTAPPADPGASATIRVQFPAGTFGTTVHGVVNGGALKRYLLRAGAGQTMTVTIAAAANNAQFSVLAPDGSVLAGVQTSTSVALPSNGDYTVAVWSTSGNATYDITFDVR